MLRQGVNAQLAQCTTEAVGAEGTGGQLPHGRVDLRWAGGRNAIRGVGSGDRRQYAICSCLMHVVRAAPPYDAVRVRRGTTIGREESPSYLVRPLGPSPAPAARRRPSCGSQRTSPAGAPCRRGHTAQCGQTPARPTRSARQGQCWRRGRAVAPCRWRTARGRRGRERAACNRGWQRTWRRRTSYAEMGGQSSELKDAKRRSSSSSQRALQATESPRSS